MVPCICPPSIRFVSILIKCLAIGCFLTAVFLPAAILLREADHAGPTSEQREDVLDRNEKRRADLEKLLESARGRLTAKRDYASLAALMDHPDPWVRAVGLHRALADDPEGVAADLGLEPDQIRQASRLFLQDANEIAQQQARQRAREEASRSAAVTHLDPLLAIIVALVSVWLGTAFWKIGTGLVQGKRWARNGALMVVVVGLCELACNPRLPSLVGGIAQGIGLGNPGIVLEVLLANPEIPLVALFALSAMVALYKPAALEFCVVPTQEIGLVEHFFGGDGWFPAFRLLASLICGLWRRPAYLLATGLGAIAVRLLVTDRRVWYDSGRQGEVVAQCVAIGLIAGAAYVAASSSKKGPA